MKGSYLIEICDEKKKRKDESTEKEERKKKRTKLKVVVRSVFLYPRT